MHKLTKVTLPHCFVLSLFSVFMLYSTSVFSAPVGHAPWVGDTLKGAPCKGGMENFGPFDYLLRNQLPGQLSIVEKHHFNPQVEQLIKGQNSISPLGDIDYTLMAWPNHHRALYSTIRHRINTWPDGHPSHYTPAECYLQRAIKFSPNDATTHMLYGILLHQTGHQQKALELYKKAIELDSHNPQIQYNLALLLVDLKKYPEARTYATSLYKRGFPLPGLRDKLKAAGQWSSGDDQ